MQERNFDMNMQNIVIISENDTNISNITDITPTILKKITNPDEYKRITTPKDEFEHFNLAQDLILKIRHSLIGSDNQYSIFPLQYLCRNLLDDQKNIIKAAKNSIQDFYPVIQMHAISIELAQDTDINSALQVALLRLFYGNQFIKKDPNVIKIMMDLYTQDLQRYSYIAVKKTLNHFAKSATDLSLPAINEYASELNEIYIRVLCDTNFILSIC